MAILRFKNGIETKSDAYVLVYANLVAEKINGNTHFPSPVPSVTSITAATAIFSQLISEAKTDKDAIILKNAKRREIIEMMHNIANYVLFIAAGNRDIAATAGIPFSKTPEQIIIAAPQAVVIEMGGNQGSVNVSVKKMRGVSSYIFQYTTDAGFAEENWITHPCTTAKCVISGLASGVPVYIRVGVVGGNGQLYFSTAKRCIPQ